MAWALVRPLRAEQPRPPPGLIVTILYTMGQGQDVQLQVQVQVQDQVPMSGALWVNEQA